MISEDAQYRYITSQIVDRIDKSASALKRFIRLFSAVVGGSICLTTNKPLDAVTRSTYVLLSDALAVVTMPVFVVLVVESRRSWYDYRWAQTELGGLDETGGHRIRPPKLFPAAVGELVMLLAMLLASALFCWFTPFLLAPSN